MAHAHYRWFSALTALGLMIACGSSSDGGPASSSAGSGDEQSESAGSSGASQSPDAGAQSLEGGSGGSSGSGTIEVGGVISGSSSGGATAGSSSGGATAGSSSGGATGGIGGSSAGAGETLGGTGGSTEDCLGPDPLGTAGYAGGACDSLYPECKYGGTASGTCEWLMFDGRHSVFEWVRDCLENTDPLCDEVEDAKVRSCVNQAMTLVCPPEPAPGDVTCASVVLSCPTITLAACEQAIGLLGDDKAREAIQCFLTRPEDDTPCDEAFHGCTGRPDALGIPGELTTLTCPDEVPTGSCNRMMPECLYGDISCVCLPSGLDLDAPAYWSCQSS